MTTMTITSPPTLPWFCAICGATDEALASTVYHDTCGACEALPSDVTAAVRAASATLDAAHGALTRVNDVATSVIIVGAVLDAPDHPDGIPLPRALAALNAALDAAWDAASTAHTNAQAAHAAAIRAAAARHP